MGRVFGVLQAAFASFCISQRLLQAAGLLGAYLLGLCDCSGLLPGVLRQLCRRGMAQLLPLVVPLGDVCGKGFQLALQACVLAATGGVVCIQLFALVLQRFQFSLRALERNCSGRDIQRRIGRYGRMLVRSTQRAGLAGLQCMAVRFQALDALFLGQQLLFVGYQLLLGLVLAAHGGERRLLLLQLGRTGFQFGRELLLLQGQRLALAGMVLQLLPGVQMLLGSLPVRTQLGQVVAMGGEPGLLRLRGVARRSVCLLAGSLGLLHHGSLFRGLLLQSQALLLGVLLLALFTLQLLQMQLALFELLAPATEVFTQLRMGCMGM